MSTSASPREMQGTGNREALARTLRAFVQVLPILLGMLLLTSLILAWLPKTGLQALFGRHASLACCWVQPSAAWPWATPWQVTFSAVNCRREERHIHVLAKRGTPMETLPEASYLQKSDFIPALEHAWHWAA